MVNRVRRSYILLISIAMVVLVVVSGIYLYSQQVHVMGEGGAQVKVVATFYPMYDFAQNVGGDRISLSLLVPEAVDVHDFEPTPRSIQEVASANVLIYNGAGLEPWIPQVITAAGNPRLVLVDSSQGISLLPVSSQFQTDNRTVDPHIWLDPELAKQQVTNILKGLMKADPADQAFFTSNAEKYVAKLDALNSEMSDIAAHAKTRYFVTFHEAFAYFARQYNLTQIPIAGPFEEEPTPGDIANVVAAINKYRLCYVGYESLENPNISQSIASQTQAKLILMDPIEGLSQSDQSAGKNYLTKMQDDLDSFRLALNSVGC
jgi:zinc transport system substrate-binding protein